VRPVKIRSKTTKKRGEDVKDRDDTFSKKPMEKRSTGTRLTRTEKQGDVRLGKVEASVKTHAGTPHLQKGAVSTFLKNSWGGGCRAHKIGGQCQRRQPTFLMQKKKTMWVGEMQHFQTTKTVRASLGHHRHRTKGKGTKDAFHVVRPGKENFSDLVCRMSDFFAPELIEESDWEGGGDRGGAPEKNQETGTFKQLFCWGKKT